MPAIILDIYQLLIVVGFVLVGLIPEVNEFVPRNIVIVTFAVTLVTNVIDSDDGTRGLSITQAVFTLVLLLDYLFGWTSHIKDFGIVIILWAGCAATIMVTNVIQMSKRH